MLAIQADRSIDQGREGPGASVREPRQYLQHVWKRDALDQATLYIQHCLSLWAWEEQN